MKVPLNLIVVPENLRPVDREAVERLKENLALLGQLQPLLLDANFTLLAGQHRYYALRELGFEEVDAVISANDSEVNELITISENLVRKELSPAERADSVGRYLQLVEKLEQCNQHGGARKKGISVGGVSPVKYTAKALGMGERTVRECRQIRNLNHYVPKEIRNSLTKKQLLLMSRLLSEASNRDDIEYFEGIVLQLQEGFSFDEVWNIEWDDEQVADDATCSEHAELLDAITARVRTIQDEVKLRDILALITHYLQGDITIYADEASETKGVPWLSQDSGGNQSL